MSIARPPLSFHAPADLLQRLRHRLAVGGDRRGLTAANSSRTCASTSAGIVTSASRRSASSSPRIFCSSRSASARACWPAATARTSSEPASASTSALICRSSFCFRCTVACAFVIATSARARAPASACSAWRTASDSEISAPRRISAIRWRPMLSR